MKKKTKLRLLITIKCNRNCEGCCNKDWDIINLPPCRDFSGYDTIMLTGGEPLYTFSIFEIARIVRMIRLQNSTAKIILYTAFVSEVHRHFPLICNTFDGITLTLHEQSDADNFLLLYREFPNVDKVTSKLISLRLNIFSGIKIPYPFLYNGSKRFFNSEWIVKSDIEWIKNCPLPDGEVLMRL